MNPAKTGPGTVNRHAAIDLGTNSFHLVVAQTHSDGSLEVVTTEKDMVRLGSGAGDMKELAPDAMDRGVDALTRMKAVAHNLGAEVYAVATSAVREAENRDVFLKRVRTEVGLDVEVISGVEEARLIHLGVLQALPIYGKRHLVVDIGGGSTEFIAATELPPAELRSTKLGAIRLTEQFFADGVGNDTERARRFIRSRLAAVVHDLVPFDAQVFVGSSGTIAALAKLAAERRGDVIRQTNGLALGVDELEELVADLAATTTADRARWPALDSKRVDIILGGAVLLAEIFALFGIDEMVCSDFALREGVLADRAGQGEARLIDLRLSNARRLADQFDPDPAHARQVAFLSMRLFDELAVHHGLSRRDRALLEAAALAHNVGLAISHSAHHKHSYYIVRNSERMTGFSERELEIVALVARYHRKSHPKPSHAEFQALNARDQRRVRVMAGILRIAIGLDRTHNSAVRDVSITVEGDDVTIEARAAGDSDIEAELFSAAERAALLDSSLGVEVHLAALVGQ